MFGLGCFWGAERKFWEGAGVFTTAVGYAGGSTPNPTYEEVCWGRPGTPRSVLVVFDPAKISYEALLKVFWENHDPTQGMRQGNDVGTQYRSAIYTFGDAQRRAAEARGRSSSRRWPPRDTARSPPRSATRRILFRRGLSSAVSREESGGLLRPRRHRRVVPDRCRRDRLRLGILRPIKTVY